MVAATVPPLQATTSGTLVTVASGFTVMVKVMAVPVQACPPLLYDGITVMVAISGAVPVGFVVVNDAISPLPEAASPMLVLSFVQL